MNWKAEAEEKLRKYDVRCRAAATIPLELRRLEQEASGLSGSSAMPHGKADARSREDRLLNNMVSRQELQAALEQLQQWIQTVDRGLNALNRQERLLLQRFYITPKTGAVDQLCEELEVEKSSVYRRRDKALEKFTLAIYGVTESI